MAWGSYHKADPTAQDLSIDPGSSATTRGNITGKQNVVETNVVAFCKSDP